MRGVCVCVCEVCVCFVCVCVLGLPRWLSGKESACQAGEAGSIPWLERSSGEGNGNPTPVFLPGKSHGSWWATVPWGRKESDPTEGLHFM